MIMALYSVSACLCNSLIVLLSIHPMKTIRYIILVCLQVICISAFCQKQLINFERLGTEQGLSQSNVICILQDSRGFMWFGTRDGLNRYDGQQIKVYRTNTKDTTTISDNFIRYIYEGRERKLWIGTANGLNLFDEAKDEFTRYKHNTLNTA